MNFPFGLSTLILVQAGMYGGLVSVRLSRTFLQEFHGLSMWSHVHGIKPWSFILYLCKNLLKKDLRLLGLLIFVSNATSLSMPMLLAGRSTYSLEFYIYEYLKDPQLWSQASFLILIQTTCILALCLRGLSLPPAKEIKKI